MRGSRKIEVRPQFQRSIRLDIDFDRTDALGGYVLQASSRRALDIVASQVNDSQQRAFTWTGPYGGGKSSLALALAQLAGGASAPRRRAKQILQISSDDIVHAVFATRKPWLVLPVVGRREGVENAIGRTIDARGPSPGRKPMKGGKRDVIAELTRRASNEEYAGVLLVLDELGKFLETAAAEDGDIFFYQELAEAASRCAGRLVVIGILHQSFDQYAARAGREVQTEWAKVQGRFLDIPIVPGSDETIELIGRAIASGSNQPGRDGTARIVADVIRRRRPASPDNLGVALHRCYPLHPVTAALLGPSSRRKFGQNERSVFGFLNSGEPLGFRDFLKSVGDEEEVPYYSPANYWDYLRANFEPAILSSPDGHRWAVCADAVERAEARFQEPHISLVKSIGIIELFRNGSGVAAELEVLTTCVLASRRGVESALADLAKASILTFRKHLNAWGVFAGSDFDIEAAVAQARQSMADSTEESLRALAFLPPVSARRHYSESGTLRWFERHVVMAETVKNWKDRPLRSRGSVGAFVLLLPSHTCPLHEANKLAKALSVQGATGLRLFGVPNDNVAIVEQASELAALSYVEANNPALEGDVVAQREINARLLHLRGELEGALRAAFTNAQWFFRGQRRDVKASDGLSPLASEICNDVFHGSPIVHSELINRDALGTNPVKARRNLLHRMLSHGDQPDLGFESFPAEAGLYHTVLKALGLHVESDGAAAFVPPNASSKSSRAGRLKPFWDHLQQFLKNSERKVTLAEIYEQARVPPFGLKEGLLPVLALAFLLTHRSSLGVYVDGVFTPEVDDTCIDEWLQDPQRISWQWYEIDAKQRKLLKELAERLETYAKRKVVADPLDSARALVSLTLALPAWTQRTLHLSDVTKAVRGALLRASDPLKVMFVDLPELIGIGRNPSALVAEIGRIIDELYGAYPDALHRVANRLFTAIDHHGDLALLRERATVVQGISGDFKLDAFSGRLLTIDDDPASIEGLISLATNKPPKEFGDHDFHQAMVQLAKWSFEFRRLEALAQVEGRSANRRALAVVFAGGSNTVSGTFDVAQDDNREIAKLAENMLQRLRAGAIRRDVFLAALAEAGIRALELTEEESV